MSHIKKYIDIVGRKCYTIYRNAHIAQLVEQQTENLCVTGSIPVVGTIHFISIIIAQYKLSILLYILSIHELVVIVYF